MSHNLRKLARFVSFFTVVCSSFLLLLRATDAAESKWPPIRLLPENPHYLQFRGRPTVLIGSTEHYGAVINADFDYVRYLNESHARELNLTRTFSGAYCEDQKSFNINQNTLAPAAGKLLAPWARSDQPGYKNGGNKFDLTQYSEAYFGRLKDFVEQSGRRGIVVELVLFCPFYEESMWDLSPMNITNNVNGLGAMPRTEVYSLKHPEMVAVHEALVRKIVEEMKNFDNLYYEVCNEPYFGGVAGEWQNRIISVITEVEAKLPARHLIACNIANASQKIEHPNPHASIFNFHYAAPPVTVEQNYGLNKVIADDETGFQGKEDFNYRSEGWDFLLAGGAIYDHLDYSFSVLKPDGTSEVDAPGGGSRALRTQLQTLKNFMNGFAFQRMSPDNAIILSRLPKNVTARALVEKGKQYAIYIRGEGLQQLELDLPKGIFHAHWIHPRTAEMSPEQTIEHSGGSLKLSTPLYKEDLALRILLK